jgi:hypothetical protein
MRAAWRFPAGALLILVDLVATAPASADVSDERALAARFAPVVRLVEQTEECGPGEPYRVGADAEKLRG